MSIIRRRVPVRLQSTSVECGVAALAMVLGYHGRSTAVAELRDRMVLSRDGASAASIARQARELGMKVRAFRAEPDALRELRLPLIAHWGMNHFVVIERFTRRGVGNGDPPARGRAQGVPGAVGGIARG
ncbi:cysteine peptidase family C39 domain-containing protein, partial [Streptomyces rubiginosohelvolus]|uniref:cysteine peptidase family C39 domain-containing protein n=1 Tax=Streptomyces rubiginosohelvolus TaxID=67362 RepID=UPI0035D8F867